jgi:hypothetical protein
MPDEIHKHSDPAASSAAQPAPTSLADQLNEESTRLRQLAEELRAREKTLAEVEANYPYFKAAVYTWLRDKARQEVPPLTEKDLETLVKEEGGQALSEFINEL